MIYITEKDLDICIITESWLHSNDQFKEGDLKPEGYDLTHIPRDSRMDKGRGGSIAVIHCSTVKLKKMEPLFIPESFELMEAHLTSENRTINLLIVSL